MCIRDRSWTAADISTSADGAYDVHVADMDGDGDLDIVSASSTDDTIAWYENDGAATWTPAFTAASMYHGQLSSPNGSPTRGGLGSMDVYVADMDGDGDLDIVSTFGDDDIIAWFENNGAADPSWTAAAIDTNAAITRTPNGIHVADMDNDGDLDILLSAGSLDTIVFYENDGNANPSWTTASIINTTEYPKK